MALTQKELQAVIDQGLDKLFEKHQAGWTKAAQSAYEYFAQNLPKDQRPRIDDVAGILTPILEVDVALKRYLQERKLTQKYWVTYFCDYILEKVWHLISVHRGKHQ